MPEAVVHCALVRVGEYRIRLADFFELFFGVRIVGISIRMVLQSQLPVSGLQLHLGDRSGHSQHLVIIAFCVRRQINPSLDSSSFSPRPADTCQTSKDDLPGRARDIRENRNPYLSADTESSRPQHLPGRSARPDPSHKPPASASPLLTPEDWRCHRLPEPTQA